MKKTILTLLGSMLISTNVAAAKASFYDFTFDALMSEKPIALSDYKGKVILIVNTASNCGLTGQYKGLENLYQKYKDQGLVIIGVPSNDFGNQEPGSRKDIAKFCQINYGVTFPMTTKYSVTGDHAHPFYDWAKNQMGFIHTPKWNFHKYLIDQNGQLTRSFSSITKPEHQKIITAIESLLND